MPEEGPAGDLPKIWNLLADYARHIDGGDAESWSGLFADNGTFVWGKPIAGRAALIEFAQTSPPGVHLPGLPSVHPDGPGSYRAESNFIFVDAKTRLIVAGAYYDQLTTTERGILFLERRVEMRRLLEV